MARLIDADKLIEKAYWHGDTPSYGKLYPEGHDAVDVEDIENAPTIDAVPVVHGKWLHDKYGANFCSECLHFAYEDEEFRMIWHTKFCPHCGARMDEKEGEQDDSI